MHLHLENAYRTAEDEKILAELREKAEALEATQNAYFLRIDKLEEAGEQEEADKLLKELNKIWLKEHDYIQKTENTLLWEIENRYIASFKGKVELILADAQKVLEAVTHEDFIKFADTRKASVQGMKSYIAGDKPTLDIIKYYEHTYFASYHYLLIEVRIYLNAFSAECNNGKELDSTPLKKLVSDTAVKWGYEKPLEEKEALEVTLPPIASESYLTMYHGKATDTLAKMSSRQATLNDITGSATIEHGEVKLVIEEFRKLKGTLGVQTHKLLSVGMARLTEVNHYSKSGKAVPNCRVVIPLKEYASLLGYDVEEHETSTPEEAEKEKKRANNALKDAKKRIKADLDILFNTSITWEEKVKGKVESYDSIHLLGRSGIKSGYINMEFTYSMAEYLAKLPLTQYPVALLGVDGRNSNAYSMGLKMAEHYSLDNNQIRGTATRLKVSTLLECTTLPTYEEVTKARKSWEERIKEPFENALDELTKKGLLENWEYTYSKGVELGEEAYTITDYETFSNLYVEFTLAEAPDHTARLEARAQEKKERQEKQRQRKRKKK